MSYIPGLSTVVIVMALASATLAADERPRTAGGDKAAPPRVLRIGAVAYAPSAVTVFENLRRYFAKTDLPVDYVLYSNYDALRKETWTSPGTRPWPTPATTCCATVRARRW